MTTRFSDHEPHPAPAPQQAGGMPTWADIEACTAAIIPVTPPPPPVLGNARLTWTAPTKNMDGTNLTGITGYRIEWGRGDFANSITVTGTEYVVPGLTAGEWQFRVRALAGSVVGQPTEAVSKAVNN